MNSTIQTHPEREHPRISAELGVDRLMGHVQPLPSERMQIVLVLHGTGSLALPSEIHDLSVGDVAVLRPGVTHEYRHCHALQLVWCRFSPFGIRSGLETSLDDRAISVLLSGSSIQAMKVPAERFRSLAALLTVPTQGGEMGNLGRLLLILETLSEAGSPPPPRVHPAVLETIKAFDRDLSRDWSLPELAERFDLDPSYMARIFKNSVGVPPMAYLTTMRAEAAAELLARTDLPCGAVGDRVGWNDPNYFSRRFRQHFGESPSHYRDRAEYAAFRAVSVR